MKGIRIYCEGGGNGRASREMLTRGFREFFKELITVARKKKVHFDIFACGSRSEAYEKFKTALRTETDSFNVLLVDAEAPVTQIPWLHLKQRDNWGNSGCNNEQCHLMVQTMEAWFMADPEALQKFYGQGFKAKVLPKSADIEQINKEALAKALKQAIKETNKPEYLKIQHGAKLLGLIAPAKVRKRSKHCDRIFTTISSLMG